MDSSDLIQRLAQLGKVLGEQVTLREPEEETKEQDPDPSPVALQSGQDTHQRPEAPEEAVDAPRKFINHDVGPRASTAGAFDCHNYELGECIGEETAFVPWKLVKKYPELYIGKTNRPHVQPMFGKILDGRVWDFFYLHDPTNWDKEPHLLVPTAQFQDYLDMINQTLGIALAIPGGDNTERFFVKFGGETPRPRYLQRSRDKKELEIEKWPGFNEKDAVLFNIANGVSKKQMLDLVRQVGEIPKKDSGYKSQKSAKKQKDRENMLKEVQGMLGITESKVMRDVVFVCFDVEAIERDPKPISEIGIALLDTRDIRDVPPGDAGQSWWPLIKAHHLRVKEYSGLVNQQYIQGCPDAFDFGSSIFPTIEETKEAIMTILNPYIESDRELVLVGHDIQQDIHYVNRLGVDLASMPSIKRTADSQGLHQVWQNLPCGRSLGSVISDLGASSVHLHNAGNDAVYTLRAMTGVAIECERKQQAKDKGETYVPALFSST